MSLRDELVAYKKQRCNKLTSFDFYEYFYEYKDTPNSVTEVVLREYADLIDFFNYTSDLNLSESFLWDFSDKLDWHFVCWYQKLPESFMRKFANKLDWHLISTYQELSESFIRDFESKLNWNVMSQTQVLPEDLIRKYIKQIDFIDISRHQELSEDFILEFINKLNLPLISRYQKISIQFIRDNWKEFRNHFPFILKNKHIKKDKAFFLMFRGLIKDNISLDSDSAKELIDDRLKDPNWQDCLKLMGRKQLSTLVNLLFLGK